MRKNRSSNSNNFLNAILLLFLFPLFAQNNEFKLIIKDNDTNKPIEDALVTVLKTKQNFFSNSDGEVTFVLDGVSALQISHLSYNSKIIKSNSLKSSTILLKRNSVELEEIIITKQPQKVLKKLIENSKNQLTFPANLKVYTREFFKKNGDYAYYNDGLLNFQMTNKNNKIESNVLVEQNRSVGVMEQDVSDELLGYNLDNLMENYYSFKYLNPLLEESAKKEYEFLIKVYAQNKNYHIMHVTPLSTSKGLLDDITIIYDPEKKLIIEVVGEISEATFARNENKGIFNSRDIYQSYYKNSYKIDGGNYYLLGSKEEIGFTTNKKNKKLNLAIRNYFITTKFSTQNFIYNPNQVFKEKTLFNKKNSILSVYWNVSGLTTTDEEQEIINKIESKTN